MPLLAAPPSKSGSWPISVGAEGMAAAQFARCGFDVLVQTGHDKPWYDLAVTKAGKMLKIAVKASDDGRWNLVHSYMGRASNGHAKNHLDQRGHRPMARYAWLPHHLLPGAV